MKLRQKIMLDLVLKLKQENINKFSEKFAVSSRTVRNDFEEIKIYLFRLLNRQCLDVRNNVIYLDITDEELNIINESLDVDNYYLYKLSTEERVILILAELIYNEDFITITYLADKLFVSRGTVNSDLILVKKWCEDNKVNLLSKRSKGLKIEENEYIKRSLISKLIDDYSELSVSLHNEKENVDVYSKFFKKVDLETVEKIVIESEEKFSLTLSDVVFEALIIHIALSIERNITAQKKYDISNIYNISENSIEYKMAKYIIIQINKNFEMEMPTEEIEYIAMHIRGKTGVGNISHEWILIQIIVVELIREVGKAIDVDFTKDERLNDGLLNHIYAAVFRLKNRQKLLNPLKDEMIRDYGYIYDAVEQNISQLQEFAGNPISQDEIAYIVIHFAASLENNLKIKNKKPKVLIVCTTGIGTSQLVLDRISQYFDFDIVNVIALHQLNKQLQISKVDLIISTVEINTEFPVITVSPLLKKTDISNIRHTLVTLGFDEFKSKDKMESKNLSLLASQVLELVENYGDYEKEEVLKSKLTYLLSNNKFKPEKIGEERKIIMLSEVLREEYMVLDASAKTWIEAVEIAGSKLKELQVINQNYIDETISNIKEVGPYVVITKGVAIPHASNKHGVSKTAISLVRLKNPVNFGNPDNDPVKYVFMLATVSENSHLNALAELVALLDQDEFYNTIDDAENADTIVEFVKKFEEDN